MNLTQNRTVAFLAPVLLISAALLLLLAIVLPHIAHADPTAAPPADPGLDLSTRLAIWGAAAYAVGDTALRFFRWRAPRTPALWDDEVRDVLDQILSHVKPGGGR